MEELELDIHGSHNIIDILMKCGVESRTKAKRLVRDGAIELNGEKITDINFEFKFKED